MAKKFNLSEDQFVFLIDNTIIWRNELSRFKEETKFESQKNYYQKEIDKINFLFDDLNQKFKTNY